MNISEQDDLLIDGYLRKTLTLSVQHQVKERMASDDAFREEVQFRQVLQQAARRRGQQNLEALLVVADEELDGAEEEGESQTAKLRRLPMLRWVAIAASVLLLVAVGWWVFRSPEPQVLYTAYYEPFPNLIAPIDKSETAESLPAKALQAYERKNYQEAVQHFEALQQAANRSVTDSLVFSADEQLYYGLSLLENRQERAAIAMLNTIADDPNARYQQAAQWYLALAWLKVGDLDKSKVVLDLILDEPEHRYYAKAQDLVW